MRLFPTSIKTSRIWNIAYPIIIGNIAQNLLSIVDTAFLGRLDEVSLGAGALGAVFYMAFIMLGMGFCIGIQIIIARRYGEERFSEIGSILHHALLFLLPFALLLWIVLHYLEYDVLSFLLRSPEILHSTYLFFDARILGIFFAFGNFVCQSFLVGIAKTKVISIVTCVMVVTNVVFDWLMIFGHGGFEPMGIRGAALASVLSECAGLVVYLLYIYKHSNFKIYRIFCKPAYNSTTMATILKVSVPASLQNFLSVASWFIFFVMVEKLGKQELAISNIGRSVYQIFLLPVWGFAAAVNSLVSYSIGCRKPLLLFPILRSVTFLTVLSVLALELLAFIFSDLVVSVYTNIPELNTATIGIFPTICVSAVLFGAGFICFNAVSGTGNTHVSLIIEVFAIIVYVVMVILCVEVWHWSILYVWLADGVYGTMMIIASLIYLAQKKWVKRKI